MSHMLLYALEHDVYSKADAGYAKPNKDQIDCGLVLAVVSARASVTATAPSLFPRLTGIASVTVTVTVTSIIGRCPLSFYL
jgi:hypothetical protein